MYRALIGLIRRTPETVRNAKGDENGTVREAPPDGDKPGLDVGVFQVRRHTGLVGEHRLDLGD
jgi:hypothetical protein